MAALNSLKNMLEIHFHKCPVIGKCAKTFPSVNDLGKIIMAILEDKKYLIALSVNIY
jgi:hypothetical protein